MAHPLAQLLDAAASGRFPEPDGVLRVVAPVAGDIDVLVAFTGTFVLAAALRQEEVDARVPRGAFAVPMSPAFVDWLATRLTARPETHDAVLVRHATGGPPSGLLEPLTDSDHPRVARARRHRRDVRVYAPAGRSGVVVLGRGVTGRWEVAYEVDEDARNAGFGRALLGAALELLPAGTPVWAQVAPGNAASMRSVIAAGFAPIGAEILFVRDPQPPR